MVLLLLFGMWKVGKEVILWSLNVSTKSVNNPAIQAGSLPVSQASNLPGYYEIPNKKTRPITNSP